VSAETVDAVADATGEGLVGVDWDGVAERGAAEVATAVARPDEVEADGDVVLRWVEDWHPASASAPTTPIASVRVRMPDPILPMREM